MRLRMSLTLAWSSALGATRSAGSGGAVGEGVKRTGWGVVEVIVDVIAGAIWEGVAIDRLWTGEG